MYEALLRDRKVKEKIMHLAHRLRDKAYQELVKNGMEEKNAAKMADSHWSIWHRGKKMSPGLLDWYVMASGLLMNPEYGFIEECNDEDSVSAADDLEDRVVDQCVSFHVRRSGSRQYEDYQIADESSKEHRGIMDHENGSHNMMRVPMQHHDNGSGDKSVNPDSMSRNSYNFPSLSRNSMRNQRG